MKKILSIVLLVVSFAVFATLSPFHKDVNDRFEKLEDATGVTFPQTDPKETAGYSYMRLIKAQYSATDDGGAENTDYALGVTVPADSMILEAHYRLTSSVVSGSNNTIALTCESAGDVIAARDLTDFATNGTTSLHPGVQAGTYGATLLTDGCELTINIGAGSTGVTAGDLDIFLKVIPTDL